MRWILFLALMVPCALVGCQLGGGSVEMADESSYETISLAISGMR